MEYSFGNLLALIRSAMNLSQDDLAEKLHVSKSLISLYESNKRKITPEKFEQICNKLGLSSNLTKLLSTKEIFPQDKSIAKELGLLLLTRLYKSIYDPDK